MRANNRMKAVARKSNRISVFIIVAVCLALGCALLMGRARLRNENAAYAGQEQYLESRIAEESARAQELAEYAEYVRSDEFCERMAREKFGLVADGEYAIKAE